MVTSVIQSRVDLACEAVLSQAPLMHREFGRAASEWKYDGTRVTPVDREISAQIMARVLDVFPEDQFFSEELTETEAPVTMTSQYSWILDPIDGTNNYALGLAHCAISLALLKDGVPVYGVVYDHSRRRLMRGGPGLGAWDGDARMRMRTTAPDAQSLIGFHSPLDRRFASDAERLMQGCKIRALGSSTLHLAYVAAGILDGVVDHNVKMWDIAAAIPLVQAVGGDLCWMEKDPLPMREFDLRMKRIFYVAGRPMVCKWLREMLGK